MHRSFRRVATATLTAGAVVLPLAAPAQAAGEPVTVATGLGFPLGLAVAPNGDVFVTEAATGDLTRLTRDGTRSTVTSAPEDGVITGVDARRTPQRVYLEQGGFESGAPYGRLMRVDYRGRTSTVADVAAYEAEENPDAGVRYGFEGLSQDCAEQVPPYAGPGEGYDGIVESNPYAVAIVPGGWVVADAAGNSIVAVRRDGTVRTLAVLPPHRQVLTQEMVDAANAETARHNAENDPAEPDEPLLPQCVVGATYAFEAVPTDVEIAENNEVYVSTLTGGPESPAFGARSRIFKIDRRTGSLTQIGSGFAGAVDLALGPDGEVYVAELFGGRISKLVDGGPQTVAEVPLPSTVEFAHGKLYATVDLFNMEEGSSLVTIAP